MCIRQVDIWAFTFKSLSFCFCFKSHLGFISFRLLVTFTPQSHTGFLHFDNYLWLKSRLHKLFRFLNVWKWCELDKYLGCGKSVPSALPPLCILIQILKKYNFEGYFLKKYHVEGYFLSTFTKNKFKIVVITTSCSSLITAWVRWGVDSQRDTILESPSTWL